MAKESFFDELWNGLGNAIADIREKVVEEPWFGRVVNERDTAPQWPEARDVEPAPAEQEHERDMDIDR